MDKKFRRIMRRWSKVTNSLPRGHNARIDHVINERAALAAAVLPNVRDGKLGVIRAGMDCDCSQYSRGYVIDFPGIVELDKRENEHRDWLDGPESTAYVTPAEAEAEPSVTRDLALEAFEDGHPHVVYA